MSKQHYIFEASGTGKIVTQAPELPGRVDIELLKKSDSKPVYVSLKIGRIGAESRNLTLSGKPRRYERAAWESMVDAINLGLVTGALGHMPTHERSTTFKKPQVYWLQAEITRTGDVYGIAYLPPGEGREHIQTSISLGMPVATSLYGIGYETEDGSVVDVELEQIDIVHHARVGIPDAVDHHANIFFSEEYQVKEQLEASQKQFRDLVEAISHHSDFKDILYGNSTPTSIIEAVQRTVAFKESPIEVFVIPGQQRRDTSEQIDYSVLMPTPKNDSWFEIPTGEA